MLRRPRAPVVLALLVAASAGLRFVAARPLPTPWIAPDEMLYGLLGRSLWATGRLEVLGGHQAFYSLVYPALAGLPLSLGDLALGYTLLKALQAVVMSLAAVVVYLWGRSIVRPAWALAAAALTLALPGLVYSGLVMTEVAFYPAVTLAGWAAARAIARPSGRNELLLAGAFLLAALTRLQALVLVPALLTAIGLDALLARDLARLRAHWRVAAVAVAGAVAAMVVGAGSLGGYQAAAHGYRFGEAAKFVAWHLGDLVLLSGVVPVCALALLLVEVARHGERSAEARATVAVAASFALWITVEVGVFASAHALRIAERDLLGLAPILFLVLVLWLDRGAPRSYAVAAAVAFAASALVLSVPFDRYVDQYSVQDAPLFAAAWRLLATHPGVDPLLLLGVPAVVLAGAFALAPRRLLVLTVPVLLLVFAVASVAASREIRDQSAARQALLLGPEPRWIDRAADGPVGFVFGGGPYFNGVWANTFWNRRIAHVYDTPQAVVEGPMPQRPLGLAGDGVMRADGRPIPDRYVVLPASLTPAGSLVASALLAGADQAALQLWRLDGVPRVLEERLGFAPNGDISYNAVLREYDCARGGTFLVTLLGKAEQTVAVSLNGRPVATVALKPDEAPTQVVHAQPDASGTCTLGLRPSTLVGTTTVRFARG